MAILSNPRFIQAMRWLFWLALVFACVMAVLPKPPEIPIDSFGDKAAHMLAFATLTGLAALAFPRRMALENRDPAVVPRRG